MLCCALLLFAAGCYNNASTSSKIEKALKQGETKKALYLLQNDENQKELAINGKNLLNTAVLYGQTDVIRFLLNKGAAFNINEISPTSPLTTAIQKNNIDIVLMLVNNKSRQKLSKEEILPLWDLFKDHKDMIQLKIADLKINKKQSNIAENTAFFTAAAKGDTQTVEQLVNSQQVPVDAQNDQGKSALMLAAENGHLNLVKWLVDNGSDLNAVDQDNETALILAAKKGYLLIIIYLLDHKADSTLKNLNGLTAFLEAIMNDQSDAAQKIFEKTKKNIAQADLNKALEVSDQKNNKDMSDWLKNVTTGKPAKISEESLQKKYNSRQLPAAKPLLPKTEKQISSAGKSPLKNDQKLLTALEQSNNKKILALLKNNNGNLNATDKNGHTPLMIAAENNDIHIITLLIQDGANINFLDLDGNTVLMIAALNDNAPAIRALAQYNVDINAKNKNGQTALMIASLYNRTRAMKELIRLGADLNKINNNGQSALVFAAYQNNADAAKILLDAGINRNLRDTYGFTAIDWAKRRNNKDIIILLNSYTDQR